MNKRGTLMALGAALAAATVVATTTVAHADIKCRQTVAKESQKLTAALAKILQKCEQAVHDGKLMGPCPDANAATKIGTAKSKFKAKLLAKCATSTGEFTFGRCPNETGADTDDCGDILVQSKDNEADCLSCLADHNATELVHRVLYGSLKAPATNKTLVTCQKTIGKSTLGFYAAASKALAKCQGSLLKAKVAACPDVTTTAALDKAESKKVAKITKACCGPDGVCGGATCSATLAPAVMCNGGTNDGGVCSADSACPGGGSCATTPFFCIGGVNNDNACSTDSECPGGRCGGGAGGAACEANRDCGRCRGGTQPGKPCSASGQCQSSPANCDTSAPKRCIGGSNASHVCLTGSDCNSTVCSATCLAGTNGGVACTVDSECPGSFCSTGTCTGGSLDGAPCHANGDCPAIGAGTCVGTGTVCQGGANAGAVCSDDSQCPSSTCGNICGGVDDLSPSNTIGLPVPCPGLTTGGSAIVQTGVTGLSLLDCVDTQAGDRAQCQDATGASFGHDGLIPSFCVDTPTTCSVGGGTQHVSVNINTGAFAGLTGISISLGYKGVAFPGIGNVTASPRIVSDQFGTNAYSDDDAELILSSITTSDIGLETTGTLYEVTFDNCGTAPTAANFGCVVRSAADDNALDVQDGVSCSVTVP